jgi:hypothetical protein
MGNCKDCAYWKKSYVSRIPGMFCDYSAPWVGTLHKCDHDWDIGSVSLDDSGLTTLLITKPMFGCVNFKEKTCK